MNGLKFDFTSISNTFYLNLLNGALFVMVALTGAVLQIEYHMHGLLEGSCVMGLNKTGWQLLHKVSASFFLPGIFAHCALNWRFISTLTRRIRRRKRTPFASLSYSLFTICILTCMTAMVSWLLFGPEDPGRHLLVESHDKLAWLLIVLTLIHTLLRAKRMMIAYRKLIR